MKISEIARMAGVSSAAVSRYINGGSISEEKKQRIKKVIEETGYVPNPTARSLRQQRSDGIGVIVPKFNSDSVSNLIEGVSTVLSKSGYLAVFGNAENDEKRELEYMHLMQETRFAGILLMGTVFTPKHIAFFRESRLPIVVCGQNNPNVTCVYHDDKGAAKEITRYMIQKGRRRIAYIGAVERDISVGVNRREGVEEAMREAQLDPEALVRTQVFFAADDGYKGMNEILDGGYMPDGVICATDTLAVGAIKALRERGFKVPDDIGVAGIGGGFAGTIVTPALTTVKLFHRECGERGAKLLLTLIEQQREKPDEKLPITQTMFGYSLIERESV
ncbi:LacI family DNA-binding transcriptional regulator [Ruminococcus sp.]|uniref:LacI family DNA-binding transcriptional regulator n=1 Tax=Ruminococcus sp. TaxID=41978 RepID=UPI002E76E521|nr:LacI family DNA-binding transcriptional regulator [Ruminococcus sp.]MEE1262730.1 LacI family DNA-binding transcriptional regulator [Ruminococcus sp.]